jgi:hypothetical protein
MLVAECLLVCLVEWAVWVAWVAWECNPLLSNKNSKGQFLLPFFFMYNLFKIS